MATISRVLSVAALLVAGASGDTIMTILLEGTQYYVSSMNPYQSELNYFLAYQHCRSLGLQLASFQAKDKAEYMMQYLQTEGYDKDFWTSGNKLGKNMAIWMSTGQPFNATFNFMRTQAEHNNNNNNNNLNHYNDTNATTPSSSGRRIRKSNDQGHDLDTGCVALMAPTFQWDLDDCRVKKHYICEQSRCYYYNYASIPVSVTKGINQTQTTITPLPAPTFLPGFSTHNNSGQDSQQQASTISTDAPPLPDYSENLAARRFPFPSPSGVVYVTAVGASDDTYASTVSDEWNIATDKNE